MVISLAHWLYVHLGIPGSGPWYGFWSGFGSDVGEVAIAGGLVTLVRRHNCHVHRCWRIGRHQVEGTPHVVCRRHHPGGHLTHQALLDAHEAALAAPPAAATRKQPKRM